MITRLKPQLRPPGEAEQARLEKLSQAMISRSTKIFNLDAKGLEVERKEKSGIGSSQGPYHAHDVFQVKLGKRHYFVKPEDVYDCLVGVSLRKYSSFRNFADSIFEVGEGYTPTRTFSFYDDPDMPESTFDFNEVQKHRETIRNLDDESSPDIISDPGIRSLFYLYLSQKEHLLHIQDKLYENRFNHHGRDVVNEFLASALGCMLGAPQPRVFAGQGASFYPDALSCRSAGELYPTRFIVSVALAGSRPVRHLNEELADLFAAAGDRESQSCYLRQWQYGNPLGLSYFEEKAGISKAKKGNAEGGVLGDLILKQFPQALDLSVSSLLDVILGAEKDRKLDEFLLPRGRKGPLVTVDYGECLFPELEFKKTDEHYLQKKDEHLRNVERVYERILGLPPGNEFRRVAGRFSALFLLIPRDFPANLLKALPDVFFREHWESQRISYDRSSIEDLLMSLIGTVEGVLGLKPGARAPEINERVATVFFKGASS